LQLDELQTQRLNPRDEAVQRGAVGHPTHQQGVTRRGTRFERVERSQNPGRQPAGDPESVFSAHVVLLVVGADPSGVDAPVDMVGAAG
jgi:hypothetical protein